MQSYSERAGHGGHFEVAYRFYTGAQGGRNARPRQHIRWDFLYEGDDPDGDGLSMIWPEFVDAAGVMRPEGEVPYEGKARMFIINPDREAFHRSRIRVGTQGFFMEGLRRVAECQVTAILALGGAASAA